MKNSRFISLLFLLMALCALSSYEAHAQETIALHPFKGPLEGEVITGLFFAQIRRDIPLVSNNDFLVSLIDLDNLPPDVPPGGFPPWICPSPSITMGSLYAITGEASPDPDFEGGTRIRLYLWRTEGGRLLGSDEMTVTDAEDMVYVSAFIEWVLSWIKEDEPIVVYIESEPIYIQQEAGFVYEPSWLYLGLRAGGGNSSWVFDFREGAVRKESTMFYSMNFAFQTSFYIFDFFALQTDLNFIYEFESNSAHGDFRTWYLNVPILAKFILREGRLSAGAFMGIYTNISLSQKGEDSTVAYFSYKPDFPGIIFGLNISYKLGPGNIILDGRFSYDGHWNNMDLEQINYRSAFRLNIGYEIGFFSKK